MNCFMDQQPKNAVPKILREHFEEFGDLCALRRRVARSPDWTGEKLKTLEARIAAHRDGLKIAGEAVIPLAQKAFADGDAAMIHAAIFSLLQLGSAAGDAEVMNALHAMKPDKLDAYRLALLEAPIGRLDEQLRAAAESAPPHIAVVAIEALLFHRHRGVKSERQPEFVRHEDPAIRAAGWRIAALE
jgi:hypothetical protein